VTRTPPNSNSAILWARHIGIGGRAKFLSRFRLFFRFSSAHKAILYAWVNDETTLRKEGSSSDPYSVFKKRLKEGNPPDDWEALFRKSKALKY